MASLFQGSPQTATSYTTSTSETPKWMQDAIYNQIQVAQGIANAPYQPYTMPTVASFSPLQEKAYSAIEANQGAWRPGLEQAQTGMQGLAGATSVGNIGAYMNPYTANVTDQIAKLGARNLSENLLPGVSDAFVRAGQFGGSRMGEFGSRALRDTQESILGQQAQALQSGYGQALGASQADLSRQQGALGQLAQLSQVGQQMSTADVAALEAAGRGQQAQKQAELNAAQQQFQNEQLYPRQQMDWLSTQIRGMAPITPTTQTQSGSSTGATYSASPLSQLATGMAAGAGLYNLGTKT
jgi:hypothetical protein